MLDQAFENLRKATESILQLQQEMVQKWVGLWPGGKLALPTGSWGEQIQQFQRKWAETVNEIVKRHRESSNALFKAGVENIEQAFHLGEAKSIEELRTKTLDLWRKCFDSLRHTTETQVHDLQATMEKWTELVTKGK
jgi:hypothetical protein